jgi:hypothetical protein
MYMERKGDTMDRQYSQDWDRYSNDFRTHYDANYANRGRDFSYYEPGYRYGYSMLDTHPEWRGRNWAEIEADAQRGWDPVHGPWDEFKEAVRNAWDRVTS